MCLQCPVRGLNSVDREIGALVIQRLNEGVPPNSEVVR